MIRRQCRGRGFIASNFHEGIDWHRANRGEFVLQQGDEGTGRRRAFMTGRRINCLRPILALASALRPLPIGLRHVPLER
jgi:hypothetical protein